MSTPAVSTDVLRRRLMAFRVCVVLGDKAPLTSADLDSIEALAVQFDSVHTTNEILRSLLATTYRALKVATIQLEGDQEEKRSPVLLEALRAALDLGDAGLGHCRCGWQGDGVHLCHRCHERAGSRRYHMDPVFATEDLTSPRETWGCAECWEGFLLTCAGGPGPAAEWRLPMSDPGITAVMFSIFVSPPGVSPTRYQVRRGLMKRDEATVLSRETVPAGTVMTDHPRLVSDARAVIVDTLEEARAVVPSGFTQQPRSEEDSPLFVEMWV